MVLLMTLTISQVLKFSFLQNQTVQVEDRIRVRIIGLRVDASDIVCFILLIYVYVIPGCWCTEKYLEPSHYYCWLFSLVI